MGWACTVVPARWQGYASSLSRPSCHSPPRLARSTSAKRITALHVWFLSLYMGWLHNWLIVCCHTKSYFSVSPSFSLYWAWETVRRTRPRFSPAPSSNRSICSRTRVASPWIPAWYSWTVWARQSSTSQIMGTPSLRLSPRTSWSSHHG